VWRARYGEEVLDFLDGLPPRRSDVLDLVRHAAAQHMSQVAPNGIGRLVRSAFGILALAVVTPSALFVALNVLQYQFGILVDNETAWWVANSSGATAILGYAGGPLISLGLAGLAVAKPAISRTEAGELIVTARLRRSVTAALAAAFSILTLLIIIGYGISESLIEALR
jgi:hypothetical protein